MVFGQMSYIILVGLSIYDSDSVDRGSEIMLTKVPKNLSVKSST
jgi:hypothetical protein